MSRKRRKANHHYSYALHVDTKWREQNAEQDAKFEEKMKIMIARSNATRKEEIEKAKVSLFLRSCVFLAELPVLFTHAHQIYV